MNHTILLPSQVLNVVHHQYWREGLHSHADPPTKKSIDRVWPKGSHFLFLMHIIMHAFQSDGSIRRHMTCFRMQLRNRPYTYILRTAIMQKRVEVAVMFYLMYISFRTRKCDPFDLILSLDFFVGGSRHETRVCVASVVYKNK